MSLTSRLRFWRRSEPPWRLAPFRVEPDAVADDLARSELGRLFAAHEGRSVHKWTQYLPAYEEQFAPYRDGFPLPDGSRRPLRMLEIGVSYGGSLQLWRRWFGPDAVIFGIDVDPAVLTTPDPELNIRIGSQADPAFLRDVVQEMGGVDIVLDDGSHIAEHQRASFDTLFPLLTDGGLYAVEDLHSSYWPEFGGAYGRGSSFIEATKQLLDDMHGWYHDGGDKLGVSARTTIPKMTMYDSVVFIAKATRTAPRTTAVGARTF